MLKPDSELRAYALHAEDGAIGSVRDFLFDDRTWLIRWLVVDTGHWLPGRRVLLPPTALAAVNHTERAFNVELTRQQVRDCPDTGSDLPVSRQNESDIYNYYGWAPYWGGGAYMGMVAYGGGGLTEVPSAAIMQREMAIDAAQRPEGDPALRSVVEVSGYYIHARDGEIGHVRGTLIDEADWSIRSLIVETRNWWPGNTVLIAPSAVAAIEWPEQTVNLTIDRQAVKASPAHAPPARVD
jgi:hypothetical protein